MSEELTLNDYAELAQRTSGTKEKAFEDRIVTVALGLTGEAGEVADLVKKMTAHGHEWDKDKLADELGDVLWYLAEAASALEMSLNEIARLNVEKLIKRYPDGFSADASIHRKI